MKSFVVALCLIAGAVAAAPSSDQTAQVLRSDSQQDPAGNFNYAFETDNGIAAQVAGVIKAIGNEIALTVTGSNQHKTPEGETIQLTYVADETGYHPSGAHLPTPPPPQPIPDYIQRSLEYNAAHPYVEPKSVRN